MGYSSSELMDQYSNLAAMPNLTNKVGSLSMDTDGSDDLSISPSNMSDCEMEQVEDDELGMCITKRV